MQCWLNKFKTKQKCNLWKMDFFGYDKNPFTYKGFHNYQFMTCNDTNYQFSFNIINYH
jgi:hypothetical protein